MLTWIDDPMLWMCRTLMRSSTSFQSRGGITRNKAIISFLTLTATTHSSFPVRRTAVIAFPSFSQNLVTKSSSLSSSRSSHANILANNQKYNNKLMSTSSMILPCSPLSLNDDNRRNKNEEKEREGVPSLATYLDSISSMTRNIEHISTSIHNHDGQKSSTPTHYLHFVLGNEAGDADSIISALTLGYVMTLEQQYCALNSSADDTSHIKRVVVPVASVPRVDLPLRRDIALLLELSGLDMNQLPCLDDEYIASHLAEPKGRLTLGLVDHNRIRSSLSNLSDLVVEILDHHEDEGCHTHIFTNSATATRRVIAFEAGRATVASTCTLVVERLLLLLTAINNNTANDIDSTKLPRTKDVVDGSLGLLLLGVILLDTINMSSTAGRGTLRDSNAITALLEQTNWSSLHHQYRMLPSATISRKRGEKLVDDTSVASLREKIFCNGYECAPNATALYEILSNSRTDLKFWRTASVSDCLRMDYKRFIIPSSSHPKLISSLGLATVLLSMDSFLSKNNVHAHLSTYVASSDVDLFGVLTMDLHEKVDGEVTAVRGLLLASFRSEIVDWYTGFLLNSEEAAFLELVEHGLVPTNGNDTDERENSLLYMRTFHQGNARMGRKQIAPILIGATTSGMGCTPKS